jgi:hypothetical protein
MTILQRVEDLFLSIKDFESSKSFLVDPIPENSNYDAITFICNNNQFYYRKAKVTPDRPGAFLTLWQRPESKEVSNKPIAITEEQLDFLVIQINELSCLKPRKGIFIFPKNLLVKKKILSKEGSKGKTGFRVFPPWAGDRGTLGMKVFSDSGKKTQAWQLPYFIELTNNIESEKLKRILNNEF